MSLDVFIRAPGFGFNTPEGNYNFVRAGTTEEGQYATEDREICLAVWAGTLLYNGANILSYNGPKLRIAIAAARIAIGILLTKSAFRPPTDRNEAYTNRNLRMLMLSQFIRGAAEFVPGTEKYLALTDFAITALRALKPLF